MTLKQIDSHSGPADVVLGDGRRLPVSCAYTVWVEVIDAGGEFLEGLKSWRGSISTDPVVQLELAGESARLELPDGRGGSILALGSDGRFTGTGPPPEH